MDDHLEARLSLAIRIARQAGELTLRYFRRSDLQVERKADDSPVTIADRAAEELLRARIAEKFPDDGILGEEFGQAEGSSSYQWVLDPIDGTKSFIHGVPLYTTLVAVIESRQPQIGVISAPAAGEMVYAQTGKGCWYLDGLSPEATAQPTKVSRIGSLRDSLVLTSEVASFDRERPVGALGVYLALQKAARLARTWGDGYGYLMVATGRAEVMIDPAMNLWDAAALQPVIEEAGGQFVDWQGQPTVYSTDSIATNGLVTDEVLAITRG